MTAPAQTPEHKGGHHWDEWEPSPEEILAQCLAFQAAWTPEEERQRRGVPLHRWTSPGYTRQSRGVYVRT